MKLKILAFATAVAMVTGLNTVQAGCLTGSATLDLVSSYVGATSGAQLSDQPGLQPSLTVGCDITDGTTVYGNTWWHVPLRGGWDGTNESAEADFTVGVRQAFGPAYADLSVAYFAVESLGDRDNDTIQPQLEVGGEWAITDRLSVNPFGRVEYVIPRDGYGDEGFNFHAGSRAVYTTDWHPFAGPATIDVAAYGVMQNGHQYGYTDAVLAHGRFGISVPVTESVSMGPYVRVATPISHSKDDERQTYVVGGFGASLQF